MFGSSEGQMSLSQVYKQRFQVIQEVVRKLTQHTAHSHGRTMQTQENVSLFHREWNSGLYSQSKGQICFSKTAAFAILSEYC